MNYAKVNNKFLHKSLDYLGNITSDTKMFGESFKKRLEEDSSSYSNGILSTLMLVGDTVYSTIKRDGINPEDQPPDVDLYDGEELFNFPIGSDLSKSSLDQLLIQTDINPSDGNINQYIGSTCRVKLVKGRAVFAYVRHRYKELTTINAELLYRLRRESSDGTIDNPYVTNSLINQYGYTSEQVNDLKKLQYDPEKYKNKVLIFEGEAYWGKDTSKPNDDEVVLKPVDSLNGLNKLGTKSNNCHLPIRLFSGR